MTSVTIVGGGMAGMSAALRLAERGCAVTLFEADTRLGGKAGATRHGQDYDDHGYHIFPAWYLNTLQLTRDLGIQANWLDRAEFKQLRPGEFPRFVTLRDILSPRYLVQNLRAGALPLPEMCLFYYSVIDLVSQNYSRRAFLDQITVNGFVRSRFYRTEQVALEHQQLTLKSVAVPSYFISAMTVRNVMRFWARSPRPLYRIFNGNLEQKLVAPLARRLRDHGVDIRLEHRLDGVRVEGDRIAALRLQTPAGPQDWPVDHLVLAIPVERVVALLDDDLVAAAPDLARLRYLHTQPMAAFNVYLRRRLANVPDTHVDLIDSPYGLSFIDVGQVWPESGDRTVLNCLASDPTTLQGLEPAAAEQAMVADLQRYLPDLHPEDIERTDYQSHSDQPLFATEVGAWRFRPEATTQLANLFLAGDYCRSHVDLVSVEGAITTGLHAAEAIQQALGLNQPVDVRVPPVYPRELFVAARVALLPAVALLKLGIVLRDRRNAADGAPSDDDAAA